MSLKETVHARLRKLLRDEFGVNVNKVTSKTKLGGAPIGFDNRFIDTDFRHRANVAFDDLVQPFGPGKWNGTSTVESIGDDIVDESEITTISTYRAHAAERVGAALDAEEVPAEGVPVARREQVRNALNESLAQLLLRDVALKDLAGPRKDITEAIVARMIV